MPQLSASVQESDSALVSADAVAGFVRELEGRAGRQGQREWRTVELSVTPDTLGIYYGCRFRKHSERVDARNGKKQVFFFEGQAWGHPRQPRKVFLVNYVWILDPGAEPLPLSGADRELLIQVGMQD